MNSILEHLLVSCLRNLFDSIFQQYLRTVLILVGKYFCSMATPVSFQWMHIVLWMMPDAECLPYLPAPQISIPLKIPLLKNITKENITKESYKQFCVRVCNAILSFPK